jgi:hypothetical protein
MNEFETIVIGSEPCHLDRKYRQTISTPMKDDTWQMTATTPPCQAAVDDQTP